MTTAAVLLEDFDAEMAGTRKTLERIPEEQPDYKPHEKSFPMGKLAMHVALMPLFGKSIVTTPGMDLADTSEPSPDLTFRSREAMLASFDAAVNDLRAALEASSDEQLAALWKFSYGEMVIMNETKSLSYRRMFLNHLIHHRAQLGMYLRLNEIAVPGLYGPSADEPFGT